MSTLETIDLDALEQGLVDRIIRFKPESKELLSPSFMGRKGGRTVIVEAKGYCVSAAAANCPDPSRLQAAVSCKRWLGR